MERWIIGAAGLVMLGLPGTAAAQDWTGFYVGADVGYSNSETGFDGEDAATPLTDIQRPGSTTIYIEPQRLIDYSETEGQGALLYGGFAGYLMQRGDWAFGVEADVHGPRDAGAFQVFSPLDPTFLQPGGTATISREAHLSWDWSARARVGRVFGDTLAYVAAGAAGTRLRLRGEDSYQTAAGAGTLTPPMLVPAIGPILISDEEEGDLTGWTIGVGAERQISSRLRIGLDARYTDYGSHSFDLAGDCFPNEVALGACGGATISGAGTITLPAGANPGTLTPTGSQFYPGLTPGETEVSLTDWRLSARVMWRF